MRLVSADVGPFKSINEIQEVVIDRKVTVLVGMNEAGKTVFLQALQKSSDVLGQAKFDPVDDYPRKDLPPYLKVHGTNPAVATVLHYEVSEEEANVVNSKVGTDIKAGFTFSVSYRYDGSKSIGIDVGDKSVIEKIADSGGFGTDAKAALVGAGSFKEIPGILKSLVLTDPEKLHLVAIEKRIATAVAAKWEDVIKLEVWQSLSLLLPKYWYFSDYDLLPSKTNLTDLAARVERAKADPTQLKSEHRAVIALLRMAGIEMGDITVAGGYEQLKAKLEGVSISLTDQIMEFWKQNEDLEVEVDVKEDKSDEAPFNAGPNLYLRIKNRRHRGVSTPFRNRSRGFIWFFSFLVWFDEVHMQTEKAGGVKNLILLLDEPALALHAKAQADFLRYIDRLSDDHQVIYTTHSPFMVHSDRLNQVRVVMDKPKIGTVIKADVSLSDERTAFPLQAALGWTVAQNLFISKRNLLVEGPSELIYLQMLSGFLESQGRAGLRNDVTCVPVGGLGNVATFVSLLGANGLEISVLHDYKGSPEQVLGELIKKKILEQRVVVNVSQFRDLAKLGENSVASDIEDLFSPEEYVGYFNKAFAKELKGAVLDQAKLPVGPRIVDRIGRFLTGASIALRPTGGYNHYLVASYIAGHPPGKFHTDTLSRFEALFVRINGMYTV